MFGSKAKRIRDLEGELALVQRHYAELKEQYTKLVDVVNDKMRDSEVGFDFKSTKAFSVERVSRNNQPCTIIGYFTPEDQTKPREWYLYCSQKVHDQLVADFKEYKRTMCNE